MDVQQSEVPQGGTTHLESVNIEDIIQTEVITAETDAPIDTIVTRMREAEVGAVVIVEEDDRPVGVLTDRTIALALEDTKDLTDQEAGDFINEDVVTVTTEMTVFDVIEQFNEAGIRRLPIVDEDGTLVGIVTLDDILILLGTELKQVTAVIESQVH